VLKLPTLVSQKFGVLGSILSGITCAGAFAAFMSTFSGAARLDDGRAGARRLRAHSTSAVECGRAAVSFKVSAVIIGASRSCSGVSSNRSRSNFMVGQAFAIAAASYFPLLFMSVWWRGMTMKGAAIGMLTADSAR